MVSHTSFLYLVGTRNQKQTTVQSQTMAPFPGASSARSDSDLTIPLPTRLVGQLQVSSSSTSQIKFALPSCDVVSSGRAMLFSQPPSARTRGCRLQRRTSAGAHPTSSLQIVERVLRDARAHLLPALFCRVGRRRRWTTWNRSTSTPDLF